MPAVSLEHLVREKASSTTLNAIAGCVLGIEVDHYLHRTIQLSESPLFTPWAGVSPALFTIVREDLATLQQAEVKPFFVFSGLAVPTNYEDAHDARAAAKAQALEELERRRDEDTLAAFAALVRPADLSSALLNIFRQEGVEFMVAPYFADAQLCSMLTNPLSGRDADSDLDAVYASSSALVFGIDRLIVDISFKQGRISFCERAVILQQGLGGLTDDQFLDAFLFAGNDYCSLVPILLRHNPPEMNSMRIRAAADVVRQNRTGFQAVEGNPLLESDPTYIERWLRARVLFKNHPVLTRDGDIVLLNAKDAPVAAAEVVGPRLPREVYFYLSRGIIAPDVVNCVLSGRWQETTPLDAGETREYRALIDALADYRLQCIDLLTASKSLHIYFEKKPVLPILYHDRTPYPLSIERPVTSLREGLQSWNIDKDFLKKNGIDEAVTLKSLLAALENPASVKQSLRPAKKLTTLREVQATSLYRLLELRAYISPDHTLSGWGKALLGALRAGGPELAVPICTSFELLKMRSIKFEPFSRIYPAASSNVAGESEAGPDGRNLARLAALLPLTQSGVAWQGMMDRNMLVAFNLAKAMQTMLAKLYDMVLVSLLLSGYVQRGENLLRGLAQSQRPFQIMHDAGLAIYANQYLSLHASGVSASDIRDMMRQRFPSATSGDTDMKTLIKLWRALFVGVDVAAKIGCLGEVERTKFAGLKTWCDSLEI
jgi:hypothetical protein